MAYPSQFLPKKIREIMKHPLLRSASNRIILALIAIIVLSMVGLAIGDNRENAEIKACKERGGTPVFRKRVQEFPVDDRGKRVEREYEVFDYCQLGQALGKARIAS
jgi:hypothetical protein